MIFRLFNYFRHMAENTISARCIWPGFARPAEFAERFATFGEKPRKAAAHSFSVCHSMPLIRLKFRIYPRKRTLIDCCRQNLNGEISAGSRKVM